MAKRNSKTAAQQCRYYEVDNIFVYMVEKMCIRDRYIPNCSFAYSLSSNKNGNRILSAVWLKIPAIPRMRIGKE